MHPDLSLNHLDGLFAGLDCHVPVFGGGTRAYVNLDNAATTPPLRTVVEAVSACPVWYSSVHRGTGFKSLFSTHTLAACRATTARFVGADPDYHVVVFCSNTTDAVNRVASRFRLGTDELFLTTAVEHHSNLLPWRFHGRVDYVRAKFPCGMMDLEHLREKLHEHRGKVRLVAVSGASNVTGLIPPLAHIARLCHEHGAMVLVDAAQLIGHRPIRMGAADDPEHLDFLAFSGHKMYAPYGAGGVVGPRDFFESGSPAVVGGGAVDLVTSDDVVWTQAPEREEAGTPNLIGICALAEAMRGLTAVGFETIIRHEQDLTFRALKVLRGIPGIRITGGCEMVNISQRVAVLPFRSERYDHALLAAILGYEWGIGVRNGCFCAHPYIAHLLGLTEDDLNAYKADMRRGKAQLLPGFVRISLGLHNNPADIDFLGNALTHIHERGPAADYCFDPDTESYSPVGFSYDFDHFPDCPGPSVRQSGVAGWLRRLGARFC